MNSETGHLFAAGQLEFPFNIFAVRGDGFHAEMEPFSNFVGCVAITDQLKDFQLTITQLLRERSDLAFRKVTSQTVDDPIPDLLAQINLAAQYLTDRP